MNFDELCAVHNGISKPCQVAVSCCCGPVFLPFQHQPLGNLRKRGGNQPKFMLAHHREEDEEALAVRDEERRAAKSVKQ